MDHENIPDKFGNCLCSVTNFKVPESKNIYSMNVINVKNSLEYDSRVVKTSPKNAKNNSVFHN